MSGSEANSGVYMVRNVVDETEMESEFESCESSASASPDDNASASESVDLEIGIDSIHVGEECVICLDTLGVSSVLMLQCAHEFHETCLKAWLANPLHRSCPLCRHPIAIELVSQILDIPEQELIRAAAAARTANRPAPPAGHVYINSADEWRDYLNRNRNDNNNNNNNNNNNYNNNNVNNSEDGSGEEIIVVEEGVALQHEPSPFVVGLCAKFYCCLVIIVVMIYIFSWIF
jgi:hypothetical protein